MLSYILYQAQEFERNHGVSPNVVYINPMHFEALFREYPALFEPDQEVRLGFRMMIVPGSRLTHPEALRLENLQSVEMANRIRGSSQDITARLPVVA